MLIHWSGQRSEVQMKRRLLTLSMLAFLFQLNTGERGKPRYMILSRSDTINTTNERGSKFFMLLKETG